MVAEDELEVPVDVADFGSSLYAVRAGPFVANGASREIHIAQSDDAGAFAIFATMRSGMLFARTAFERSEAFPLQRNHWERGRSTPGGTSYFDGEIWLLGEPTDTDEYDTPVILHELGHYIQSVYRCTDTHLGSGSAHDGVDTDPRLAWSEGWATLFSSVARDSSEYMDTYGEETGLYRDLTDLPTTENYMGRPSMGLTQTLGEYLIAGSLWQLYVGGAAGPQALRSMSVIRDWFDPQVADRGAEGADLVDFLDGYLCMHEGAGRGALESYLVEEREFPYDFAGECPSLKPGRPQVRSATSREPPMSATPGHARFIVDARGRSLRETRVSRVDSLGPQRTRQH